MLVESSLLVSAAAIAPGKKLYVVVLPFKHPSLREGDVVKMVEVGTDNIFIRADDLTAHALNHDDKYVMVIEKKNNSEKPS